MQVVSIAAFIREVFSGRAARSVCHLSLNSQDFAVNEALEFFVIMLESDTQILENSMLIALVRLRLCFYAFDVSLDANFRAA